jgi:hypothetical protein
MLNKSTTTSLNLLSIKAIDHLISHSTFHKGLSNAILLLKSEECLVQTTRLIFLIIHSLTTANSKTIVHPPRDPQSLHLAVRTKKST